MIALNILVTGTTGTICPYIVDFLYSQKHYIIELTRRESMNPKISKSVLLPSQTLTSIETIADQIGDVDIILHCALLHVQLIKNHL